MARTNLFKISGLVVCFLLALALIPSTTSVSIEQPSKNCFCSLQGNYCVVPVKTAWGNQLGWYSTKASDNIKDCTYSSGNWLVDALSFRTGRDYSSQSFLTPSSFELVCRRN